MPRLHRSVALLACAAGLSAAAAVSAAPASLLDRPPRQLTFKLDDPAEGKLTLLDPFRASGLERPSRIERYLHGPWSRWNEEPWWRLHWSPGDTAADLGSEESAEARVEQPGDEPPPLLDDGSSHLFGFEPSAPEGAGRALDLDPSPAPRWLSRVDPVWAGPLFATTGQSLVSNGFDTLWKLPPVKPIPNWRCRRRAVTISRYGGETDAFFLVRCDGTVAPEALDRLTLMARVTETPRPSDLLPDEPDPGARPGEWLPGVRLVHPRLLWALQRIADAFPWRTIYIYSGYRPGAKVNTGRAGSHQSMHSEARALDISVLNVPNEALFKLCHGLDDIGCGYYPHGRFIHVDVRAPSSGHPFWIDTSGPGEPANYVDSWPGVVDHGGLAWSGEHQSMSGSVSGAEAKSAH
ncbi:MAG: D-Ala-D-Ala carboxypeptidase family metallohydrolase [Byssovorax sp.]